MLFAATLPERTRALVLFGTYSHFRSSVLSGEKLEAFIDQLDGSWGSGDSLSLFAPSRVKEEGFRRWWARYERSGACPSSVGALARRYAEVDVRSVLPAIRTPTLVLHRTDDCRVAVEGGRYLGGRISGAKYVKLPGSDHLLWAGDTDQVTDEIEEFLTGARHVAPDDSVLATVLFTDIVDSTNRAQELGDRKWRTLIEYHDAVVSQEIGKFRGRVIKTLGDGFLATFDGPVRAVHCASNIVALVRLLGLNVRTGLHTGEVQFKGNDVGGLAVTVAARISALASADQILVSRTVRDLVIGSGIPFADYGVHSLKGLKKDMHLYEVDQNRLTSVQDATKLPGHTVRTEREFVRST
jgi:class 3 adenylate cyclase